ncbi:MAG: hypothetical protein V8S74_07290 [Lachnospirales bacterium]
MSETWLMCMTAFAVAFAVTLLPHLLLRALLTDLKLWIFLVQEV